MPLVAQVPLQPPNLAELLDGRLSGVRVLEGVALLIVVDGVDERVGDATGGNESGRNDSSSNGMSLAGFDSAEIVGALLVVAALVRKS